MSRAIRRYGPGSGDFGLEDLSRVAQDRPPEFTDTRDPNASPETPKGNELDLTTRALGEALFEGCGAHRIAKYQIRCRKCRREVEMTQQTGLNAGRRIICCAFYCHGEKGSIKICQDQLSSSMFFDVFEGEPALRAPTPKVEPIALPAKEGEASGPITIDVDLEVIPPARPALREPRR